MGAPAEILNVTLVAGLWPVPDAMKLVVNEPAASAVPLIVPVSGLSESPAGKLVCSATHHAPAGRFSASLSAIVAKKLLPTLPSKTCPSKISGQRAFGSVILRVCVIVAPLRCLVLPLVIVIFTE